MKGTTKEQASRIKLLLTECQGITYIFTSEFSHGKGTETLKIAELHLSKNNKLDIIKNILKCLHLTSHEVAYIGYDYNDLEMMDIVNFTACRDNAINFIRCLFDYVCQSRDGKGSFRDLIELLFSSAINPLSPNKIFEASTRESCGIVDV